MIGYTLDCQSFEYHERAPWLAAPCAALRQAQSNNWTMAIERYLVPGEEDIKYNDQVRRQYDIIGTIALFSKAPFHVALHSFYASSAEVPLSLAYNSTTFLVYSCWYSYARVIQQ